MVHAHSHWRSRRARRSVYIVRDLDQPPSVGAGECDHSARNPARPISQRGDHVEPCVRVVLRSESHASGLRASAGHRRRVRVARRRRDAQRNNHPAHGLGARTRWADAGEAGSKHILGDRGCRFPGAHARTVPAVDGFLDDASSPSVRGSLRGAAARAYLARSDAYAADGDADACCRGGIRCPARVSPGFGAGRRRRS